MSLMSTRASGGRAPVDLDVALLLKDDVLDQILLADLLWQRDDDDTHNNDNDDENDITITSNDG